MKDMGSVARAYMVVMGRNAVFDAREVERMTEKLIGMVGESNADSTPGRGQATGKKLWSFVRRKSVKHSV